MIHIRRWKYSQRRGEPVIEYGTGKDWGKAVGFQASPHAGLTLELELNYDCRNKDDSHLVKDLVDALLAVRDKSVPT
jgi:hypothetical protein